MSNTDNIEEYKPEDLEGMFDLDIDLDEFGPIETLEENPYVSDDALSIAKGMVDYSIDSIVRILALNESLAIIFNSLSKSKRVSTLKKINGFYKEQDVSNLMDTNKIIDNRNKVYTAIVKLKSLYNECQAHYNSQGGFNLRDDLLQEIEVVAQNCIPATLATSSLINKIGELRNISNKMRDGGINTAYCQQALTIIPHAINEFEVRYQSMLETNSNKLTHVVKDVELISDLTISNPEEIQTDEDNYKIPDFMLKEQLLMLLQIREKLDSSDLFDQYIPSIYELTSLELTGEKSKYLNANGNLIFSLDSNAKPYLKIDFIPNEFSKQIHLIGITDKHLKLGVSEDWYTSLTDLYISKYNKMLENLKLKPYSKSTPDSILEVSPVYYSKAHNAIILVDNSSDMCSCKALGEYKEGFKSNLEALTEFNESRVSSISTIYYTVLTASPINSSFISLVNSNKYLLTQKWACKYTNPELGRLVLESNIKQVIGIPLKELKNKLNIIYKSKSMEERQVLLATLDAYTKQQEILKDRISCSTIPTFNYCKSITLSKDLTFVRTKLIGIMAELMKETRHKILSELELEDVYKNNKEYINSKIAQELLLRADYEMQSIVDILGKICEEPGYIKEVLAHNNAEIYDTMTDLITPVITDELWFITRLNAAGLSVLEPINKYSKTIKVNNRELNHEQFIDFILETLTSANSLREVWGYSIPNERVKRGMILYPALRASLAQAYGVFYIIRENMDYLNRKLEEVNNLYTIKNLVTKQVNLITEQDNDYMDKYGLTEEFYTAYMKYIYNQINGVAKANGVEFKEKVKIDILAKAYMELLWETKTDKAFSHQLANVEVKKLPTLQQIRKHDENALDIIKEFIELRNKISPKVSVVQDFLDICNLNITKPNEELENLINCCVYLTSINCAYAYELFEFLKAVAKNRNLDDFTKEDAHKFNVLKGFDGCSTPVTSSDVDLSKTYSEAFILHENLFPYRDNTILSTILTKRNRPKINQAISSSKDENEQIAKLVEVYKESLKLLTLDKALSKLLRKVIGVSKDGFTVALKYIGTTLPTEWDNICLINSLSNQITNETGTAKYSLDISRLTIKADKKPEEVEERLNKLKQKADETLRKCDILKIISAYIPQSAILDNNNKFGEIKDEIQDMIEEDFIPLDSIAVKNEHDIKKSIALYKQYLRKGDERYLEEVNMDAIPFELLTNESSDNAVTGHYAKSYLRTIYSIVDEQNQIAIEQYNLAEFGEIFEMIMESEPNFLEDAPLAIKECVLDHERFNRSITAANFK